MIVDMPEEFFDYLDRLEAKAAGGDGQSTRVLAHVVAALADLAALPDPPTVETPSLKRVRQSGRYPVWRTAHPFDEGVAVRVICWFPPDSDTVVVALFAADKARMGDVFYSSVGPRADVAIERWIFETGGGDQ
ncbi:hypothetical protein FOV72_20910 [Gordonia rubripertincta]|uniref:hypothetical protein n=1 Tax=Gordonia rubripertincta TaxID=36822 RepID=UPI00117E7BB6|nr:hypothetical protein [Gordonia rubripertincta]TSD93110.1 hypothetical protein FOV72_20910 [Gordonia rubripertincta]